MSVPVVILAGGYGTRLREETETRPKPMVEIGGHPILWHIMKIYASYGFEEFVICLGYKGDIIKEYFLNYRVRQGSLSVDLRSGHVNPHSRDAAENWLVHLLETGQDTMTGGRVKRAADVLRGRRFMLTYGDGIANVDLRGLLDFHEAHGKMATITAVRPPSRFGGLTVVEPGIVDYIDGDATVLERRPLEALAQAEQLAAFRHDGFWQCMDTIRDKQALEEMWLARDPPWKVWPS